MGIEDPNWSTGVYIATSSSVHASQSSLQQRYTYQLTYYTANNNAWYSTSSVSWQMQTLSNNYVPMANNNTMFLIYTRKHSLTGYIGEPSSPLNGEMLIIKDANGNINNSQIQIVSTNSNAVDGSTANKTLNTSRGNLKLLYSGSGSSGSFFII